MDTGDFLKGLLLGLGGASGIWQLYWSYRVRKIKKQTLRDLLTDERWNWRTIESLQRVIRESPEKTRELLIEIGAQASLGEKEVWTLDKK